MNAPHNDTSDEFVFAPHTEIWTEHGDELVASTTTPACDFCLDTRVVWEYPCEEFVLTEIQFGSRDNWLACERCASYIEGGLLAALTLRSMRSWIKRYSTITKEQLDGISQIQQGFFEHRTGPRFPYEP